MRTEMRLSFAPEKGSPDPLLIDYDVCGLREGDRNEPIVKYESENRRGPRRNIMRLGGFHTSRKYGPQDFCGASNTLQGCIDVAFEFPGVSTK